MRQLLFQCNKYRGIEPYSGYANITKLRESTDESEKYITTIS